MAARVKKRTDTTTNRESDKIIVRLPAGMRAHLADMAARHGKSMTAEVITALAIHIAKDGDVDQTTIKSTLAELSLEIKHLRDTLGFRDYEPSPQTQELLRKAKKNPPA
jgi:plasmid stability protein